MTIDLTKAPATLRRKLRVEANVPTTDGFPQMGQPHYLLFLADLHKRLKPKVYFEIGTESGASLSFADCTAIAVDPQFRIEADVTGTKPELHLYQGTSDAFFESDLLGRLGYKIDLAFLDGMHWYEFLLRDFMNTEPHMNPDGFVTMHDCVPFNHVMAEREWDRAKTISWTGDVWKVVAILRKYRPDLTIDVIDTPPTGLVCIRGLDPANTVLRDNYDAIIAEWDDVTLESYGVDQFRDMIDIQPATQLATPRVTRKTNDVIALKTCTPSDDVKDQWGDYHFAKSLSKAFEGLGYKTRIDNLPDWASAPEDDMLDLVIHGQHYHAPRPGIPCLMWMIYPGRRFPMENAAHYDHVFVASTWFTRRLARRAPGAQTSYLPQAFDPDIMKPSRKKRTDDVVFVGNKYAAAMRPVVAMAQASDVSLKLWGNGWDDTPMSDRVQAPLIANTDVGGVYGTAQAVLCDHMPAMGRRGFLSNRALDALACATPLIMDRIDHMPEEFAPWIHTVSTQDEFDQAIADIRAEDAARIKERKAFAKQMQKEHTFEVRARQILEKAKQLALI